MARGLAFVIGAIFTVWILSKKTRLDMYVEGAAKILISGVIMAVAVRVVQILKYNEFLLPVYVPVGLQSPDTNGLLTRTLLD